MDPPTLELDVACREPVAEPRILDSGRNSGAVVVGRCEARPVDGCIKRRFWKSITLTAIFEDLAGPETQTVLQDKVLSSISDGHQIECGL